MTDLGPKGSSDKDPWMLKSWKKIIKMKWNLYEVMIQYVSYKRIMYSTKVGKDPHAFEFWYCTAQIIDAKIAQSIFHARMSEFICLYLYFYHVHHHD